MPSQRIEKVQELIKEEISEIIRREVKHPGIGFVTVTSVEASPDLRHAKVFVSILGDDAERQRGLKALQAASGFIRSALGRRIRLRFLPEIAFKLDTSIDHGIKIQQLLKEINEGGVNNHEE